MIATHDRSAGAVAHTNYSLRRCLVFAALGLSLALTASGADLEQVIVLQPGWNAVFLEVEPQPNTPDAVFQGIPVSSVWRWNPEGLGVDFLRNPADGLSSQPGWLGYFPPHRPESILTNLFGIEANTAYLIKLEGASPVTWRLRGVPVLRDTEWIANSFNLRGFNVNPGAEPSFGDFFGPSPEHTGQPVYRLTEAGIWEPVTALYSTPIRSGKAYWVYCDGPSDYQGPIEIHNEFGDGIEFGGSLQSSTLVFKNRSLVPAVLSVRLLSVGSDLPLMYRNVDEVSAEVSWPELPSALTLEVEGRGSTHAELGIDRSSLTGRHESVLEVVDSLGTRRRLAISAGAAFSEPPPVAAKYQVEAAPRPRSLLATKAISAVPTAGLWVGTVSINAVSESQVGSVEPVSTGTAFDFRVLIHVRSDGKARLLKEVIQMWQEGTVIPDPENPEFLTVEVPGRYVLLTDESLIPSYSGAELRDGTPVGLRVSTAAYDFPEQFVDLNGSFDLGSSLSCTISLDAEAPTNPFRAKYHPDHDNLDALYLDFREEAYTVIREMEFDFTVDDPEGKNLKPGWGDTQVGGIFRETISGLHRNDIAVEGIFRLNRVSYTPELNE